VVVSLWSATVSASPEQAAAEARLPRAVWSQCEHGSKLQASNLDGGGVWTRPAPTTTMPWCSRRAVRRLAGCSTKAGPTPSASSPDRDHLHVLGLPEEPLAPQRRPAPGPPAAQQGAGPASRGCRRRQGRARSPERQRPRIELALGRAATSGRGRAVVARRRNSTLAEEIVRVGFMTCLLTDDWLTKRSTVCQGRRPWLR
jgi:hypothetical protein